MITTFFKTIGLSALLFFLLGVPSSPSAEDLIAPTRTLEGNEELLGRLTVVSEPPNLEVYLDGTQIGETPIWLKEVKPGPHELRVQDSEKDVYLEPGKTPTLSLFKGSFIEVSKEKEEETKVGLEPEKLPEPTKVRKPREEERPRDLTPWERFINRTSPNF